MNDSRAFMRRRMLGLAGTALVYVLLGVVLSRVHVGWLQPTDKMASEVIAFWRDLPFFSVEKGPGPNGQGEATYYTVPTRQVTPRELALMMGTNTIAHPALPPGTGTPARAGTGRN